MQKRAGRVFRSERDRLEDINPTNDKRFSGLVDFVNREPEMNPYCCYCCTHALQCTYSVCRSSARLNLDRGKLDICAMFYYDKDMESFLFSPEVICICTNVDILYTSST